MTERLSTAQHSDFLNEGMAARSSILAWRVSWTEEPSELQSKESDVTEWAGAAVIVWKDKDSFNKNNSPSLQNGVHSMREMYSLKELDARGLFIYFKESNICSPAGQRYLPPRTPSQTELTDQRSFWQHCAKIVNIFELQLSYYRCVP